MSTTTTHRGDTLATMARRLRVLATATESDHVSRRILARADACERGERLAEDAAAYLPGCPCLTFEEHLSSCRVAS